MTLSDNVKKLREEIADTAIKAGRDPDEIMLVAATKTQTTDAVKEAVGAGVDACGENREQEMTRKHGQGAYTGAPLHFIGHLQTNKLKKVVGVADLIQSVDSAPLLEKISAHAEGQGIVQDILMQVNIGDDPGKFGASREEVSKFLSFSQELPGVKVRGLMTILPLNENSVINRRFFDLMYKLFVDIKQKRYDNISMDFLSMGMSGDYCDAIMSGANMVRIGSAIFGLRKNI